MLNEFETLAGLEERNRVAGYRSTAGMTTRLSEFYPSISNKYLLLMIVACLVGSLTSTIAYSQELPSDASTWGAARFPTAWRSAENAQSETAPQLVMSMTAPTDLKASDSIRTAGAQPNSDRQTEARRRPPSRDFRTSG